MTRVSKVYLLLCKELPLLRHCACTETCVARLCTWQRTLSHARPHFQSRLHSLYYLWFNTAAVNDTRWSIGPLASHPGSQLVLPCLSEAEVNIVAANTIQITKIGRVTYLGALSCLNATLIPRISAHPQSWPSVRCTTHRPTFIRVYMRYRT